MAETLPWQTPQAVLASPMAIASQISAKSGREMSPPPIERGSQQAEEAVVRAAPPRTSGRQFLALLDRRAGGFQQRDQRAGAGDRVGARDRHGALQLQRCRVRLRPW